MSMLSSLDALDAAPAAAAAAPRAALFQPKVKPRARRGGGGEASRIAAASKPPPDDPSTPAADPPANAEAVDPPVADSGAPVIDDAAAPAGEPSPESTTPAGVNSPLAAAPAERESDGAAMEEAAWPERGVGDGGPSSPREEEGSGAAVGDGEEEGAAAAAAAAVSTRMRRAAGRTRRGGFKHSTSQPRNGRREREGVSPKVDFAKSTDLSATKKLALREVIRRAEVIERKKVKVGDGGQKAVVAAAAEPARVARAAPGKAASVAAMAPKLVIVDGKMVVDEQSLTVGALDSTRHDTESYRRVEETGSRLNYNSYSNRAPAERWKADETDVFYRALQQFGTDFELIQNLFPGRTRRQVKAKFKKEERSNPRRLQDALAFRPKDQVHYTDMITRLKAEEPDHSADDDDDPVASALAFTAAAAAAAAAAGAQTGDGSLGVQ